MIKQFEIIINITWKSLIVVIYYHFTVITRNSSSFNNITFLVSAHTLAYFMDKMQYPN